MKKVTFISCVLFSALAANTAVAENTLSPLGPVQKNAVSGFPKAYNRWTVGLQAGTNLLHGDADKLKPGWMAGLNAKYSFGHTFSLRGVANYGMLSAAMKEDKPPVSNFEAKNTFWEASLQAVFTMGNISYVQKARKITFYNYIGFGWMGSNIASKYTETMNSTARSVDTSYTLKNAIVPFGAGINWRLSDKLDLAFEYGVRVAFSDNVDGLNYLSPNNRSNTDFYSAITVGVNYKLGKNAKHIDWENPVAGIYENMDTMQSRVDKVSQDSDGDGVSDMFDKEPNTPEGAKVYGDGSSEDSDGDKVPNKDDVEPFSPKGAAVDAQGKAVDADADGVADALDISPNTDTSLMVNHQGIPIMTKSLARELAAGGGVGGAGYMPAILFSSGSSTLTAQAILDLNNIANMLKANTSLKLTIVGNADARGGEKFNETLGMKRADAVKKILVDMGIDASRLTTKTEGEKNPVVNRKDAASLAANRRVQFFLTK